jgi:hypothetical protein
MPSLPPLPPHRFAVVRTPKAPKRSLGDKLQEISARSIRDYRAFDELADLVLERLNNQNRHTPQRHRG